MGVDTTGNLTHCVVVKPCYISFIARIHKDRSLSVPLRVAVQISLLKCTIIATIEMIQTLLEVSRLVGWWRTVNMA